jgi:serine/threonine protein phosphatase PrpC
MVESPVLGRASSAAAAEPVLADAGEAAGASWRADGGSSAWFTLRAASVAGVRHRLAGEPCQDSFAWRHRGPLMALAVADGLGSVEGSAVAARIAARRASDVAVSDGISAAVSAANEAVETFGATTLLVAVVSAEGQVELGRVGDSTAFLVGTEGSWKELFVADSTEVVGTETNALPSDDLVLETARSVLEPGGALVLATDGLANPWRDGPSTVAPVMVSAFAEPLSALELARLTDFSRQGCHDDRTAVCLWRR